MKKDSKIFSTHLSKKTYNKLHNEAKKHNCSKTAYIEKIIANKRNRVSKNQIALINNINQIIALHNGAYKALNSATSNLNQLTYNLHINDLPTSDEILDIIDLVKVCVNDNKLVLNQILDLLNLHKTRLKD